MKYHNDKNLGPSTEKVFGIPEQDAEGLPMATAYTEGGEYQYLLLVPPVETEALQSSDFGMGNINDNLVVSLIIVGFISLILSSLFLS
jgi:hypothetical protein